MSSTTTRQAQPGRRTGRVAGGLTLPDLVAAWVADGIISPEQAKRILERGAGTPSVPAPQAMRPLIVEVIGYLGGVVVVVGCGVLAGLYWSELGHVAQVALLMSAAAALVAAGFAVSPRIGGAAVRLRSVLWVAATAAWAGAVGVWATAMAPWWVQDHVGVLVTAGATVLAAALWTRHRVVLQQVLTMGLLAALAATTIADIGSARDWPGVGVWIVGLAWLALGWVGVLRPARVSRALGAATTVVGAMIAAGSSAGTVLMLLTALGVVLLAVFLRDLVLLIVGALGLLQGIPTAVNRWFPNSIVAALTLLVVGLGLVGVAVWIARRPAPGRQHDH
jgi:hypothetical protein